MVELISDCSKCAALCCMALDFDRSDMFAFDKKAGEPCRHLRGDFGCGIHENLDKSGMKGCGQYQCDGAGQRVVQEVFSGRNWLDDPALRLPMIAAFGEMRQVHRQLVLLKAAEALALGPDQKTELARLRAQLSPPGGWTEALLAEVETSGIMTELRAFFTGLRALAPKPGHGTE